MITEKLYFKLFNELTDILETIKKMEERIKQIQIETEEMYISEDPQWGSFYYKNKKRSENITP